MLCPNFLVVSALITSICGKTFDRPPLSYAEIPDNVYEPQNKAGETTLLDLINSRDELSELAKLVDETPG